MNPGSIKRVFCGFSTYQDHRVEATSGGVGSEIVLYLLKHKLANSALSFSWNPQTLQYDPVIVDKESDYKFVGSIYHEVPLLKFIRSNRDKIKSPFVCFALPCQGKGIKKLLEEVGIQSYIIQLTCSSQQSFEATMYLFKRLGVDKSDVKHIQYRGNGWPSGIQIKKSDNTNLFISNSNSIWMDIFHSRLFIQRRCHRCNPNLNSEADIVLADPWRIDIPSETNNKGRTLCAVLTDRMEQLIKDMEQKNIIHTEDKSVDEFLYSQIATIRLKKSLLRRNPLTNMYENLLTSRRYRTWITANPLLFKLHCTLNNIFKRIITRIL